MSFNTEKEDESIVKVKDEMGSFLQDIGLLNSDNMIPIHKRKKFDESDDEFKTILTVLITLEKLFSNENTCEKASNMLVELLLDVAMLASHP
ncbi:MAG: hypothetical protein IPK55_11675 [Streptococcus sp.]|nr:hypothetical protein [Streptococcus sp.]